MTEGISIKELGWGCSAPHIFSISVHISLSICVHIFSTSVHISLNICIHIFSISVHISLISLAAFHPQSTQ